MRMRAPGPGTPCWQRAPRDTDGPKAGESTTCTLRSHPRRACPPWGARAEQFSWSSTPPPFPSPSPQARGSDLRVHFKNSREAAASIRGKDLAKAKAYLQAVLEHKRAIPFLRFNGGVGRTSQAKNEGNSIGQARWPKKSVDFLLNLLKNAESNAEVGGGGAGSKAAPGGGRLGDQGSAGWLSACGSVCMPPKGMDRWPLGCRTSRFVRHPNLTALRSPQPLPPPPFPHSLRAWMWTTCTSPTSR